MQWQMVTPDPARAASFFSELFGWRIDANNALGYRVVDTCSERGIDGGIWPAPRGAQPFVQLFVEVDDIAATVDRATRAGATVLVPPQKLPDGDEMAVLHDPLGMPFALVKSGAD
jgi:predicted enzyme related to lactoylglutathione lyase